MIKPLANRLRRSFVSSTILAPRLADHTADYRMVALAAMAVVVGTGGAAAAWVLLKLIALATNLA